MDDLNDFAAGVTLKVTCLYRLQSAAAKSRPINGSLCLTNGKPVEWHPFDEGGGHALPGPLVVRGTAEKGFGPYAGFELDTASESAIAYMPKPDIALIKHVMTLTGSWKVAD